MFGAKTYSVVYDSVIDGRLKKMMETRFRLENGQDPDREGKKIVDLYNQRPPFKCKTRTCKFIRTQQTW